MSQSAIDRRQFGKRLTLAAATTATANAVAKDKPKPQSDSDESASAEKGADRMSGDLLLQLLQQRYPDRRLTGKVLASIRQDIAGDLSRSRVLKSVALNNSDEPATVFSAYRSDDIR